jgi:hypothetical protein
MVGDEIEIVDPEACDLEMLEMFVVWRLKMCIR